MRLWQFHTFNPETFPQEIHRADSHTDVLNSHIKLISSPGTITFIFVFLLFFALGGFAANQDSLQYVFRQDNLSSNNDLELNYRQFFSGSDLRVHDVLRYKVFSYDTQISNDKQYSIEHRLLSEYSWGKSRRRSIRMESSQHEDHRTGLTSSIDNWALLAGLKYHDDLSFYFGGRSVERYGIVDKGWTTELDIRKRWVSSIQQVALSLYGTRDQLDDHLSHNLNTRGDYLVHFGDISSFRTSIHQEGRLQRFYTDSLGSSQSRNIENLVWQNMFVYHLGQDLQLGHRLDWGNQLTEISRTKVDQNSSVNSSSEDRKRFSLLNETTLELNKTGFNSTTAFKIENSQNKYYVDYTQVLYQLKEAMMWPNLGPLDSLTWITSLSRLEYDTPDTTNDDDRDEWRLNTEIKMIWEPSAFYRVELGSKLGLFHLIYLFNTRSSENHWNRNLVLWSGVNWVKRAWSGEGLARIRSNYFDYDYDDLFIEMDQLSRSFVHRSLDLNKKLSYDFGRRWSASTKASFRWEDEGKLNWDSFIQQVNSSRKQSEFSVQLYYLYKGWQGSLGYLSHERVIDYSAVNRDTEKWRGQGPLMGVTYKLGPRVDLRGESRFISVRDGDRKYMIPKVYFTLVYR